MKVSKVLTTGSAGSGAPLRAFTWATQSCRSPWPLHAARPRVMASVASAMAMRVGRMSLPSLVGRRLGILALGLLVAEVAVGLHRAFQHQLAARWWRVLAATRLGRGQRHVVHGQDHHARQRRDPADEGAELVVGAL